MDKHELKAICEQHKLRLDAAIFFPAAVSSGVVCDLLGDFILSHWPTDKEDALFQLYPQLLKLGQDPRRPIEIPDAVEAMEDAGVDGWFVQIARPGQYFLPGSKDPNDTWNSYEFRWVFGTSIFGAMEEAVRWAVQRERFYQKRGKAA